METYNFVGYGSLLSHKSLKETIKDKKFKKVLLNGYKRVFNLSLSEKYNEDVLNLVKSRGSSCNAVIFKVTEKELEKLNHREAEYNLEEIPVYDLSGKKIGKALASIDKFIKIDNEARLPSKSYLKLCRDAAYKIGKRFGKIWDDTTFLADGRSVREYFKDEKPLLKKNSSTK